MTQAPREGLRAAGMLLMGIAIAGCASTHAEAPRMPDPFANDSFQFDGEGFVIQGPDSVTLRRMPVGGAIWQRGAGEGFDYFGDLQVEGVIQIDTPPGTQYTTWFRFDKRLRFVVKDLADGSVQTSSYVDGGWNLARQGVSVNQAPHPSDMLTEAAFNRDAPTGTPVRRHFTYSVDDHLPSLYAAPTTLEIHGEYQGLRSNTIVVRVEIAQPPG